MLFYLERRIEKHQSDEKQVNCEEYFRVLTNTIPGLLHLCTPMDIVKHINALLWLVLEQPIEISKGRFKPMIPVNKYKIGGGHFFQLLRQYVIKISAH